MYGVLGLYLLVTTPSSFFFETFSAFAGASVISSALMDTDLDTLLGYKYVFGQQNNKLSIYWVFSEVDDQRVFRLTLLKVILSVEEMAVLEDKAREEEGLEEGTETAAVTAAEAIAEANLFFFFFGCLWR